MRSTKVKGLIVSLMILWDMSLHYSDVFHIWIPLYPYFPLFNLIPYHVFWAGFWTVALALMMSILIDLRKVKENDKRS